MQKTTTSAKFSLTKTTVARFAKPTGRPLGHTPSISIPTVSSLFA